MNETGIIKIQINTRGKKKRKERIKERKKKEEERKKLLFIIHPIKINKIKMYQEVTRPCFYLHGSE